MTLKNGEIWKINFRFCQKFTPHYLKTSYGKGTPCSYRVVGKKSETLGMCIGVRFGFVLGKFCPFKENEYRSEHLAGIFGNFWEFLSFTLGYNFLQFFSKHWNKGPRGPDTLFHYSNVLLQKIKNFELQPSKFFDQNLKFRHFSNSLFSKVPTVTYLKPILNL